MTVSTQTNRWAYTGDGSTAAFAYDNVVYASSDLKVYVDGALKTLTTHYTVSGVGVATGGSVTFTGGNIPTAGQKIVIAGDIPNQQPTGFAAVTELASATLERLCDRIVRLVQQLRARIDRTLRLSEFDEPTSFDTLPVKASRATKVLGFDANGQPVASTQTLAQIEAGSTDAAASAVAAAASAGAASASASAASGSAAAASGSAGSAAASAIAAAAAAASVTLPIPIGSGGTGQTTAAGARTALGLGTAAVNDTATQAQVDAGMAGKMVAAAEHLASPGYGRGFRNWIVNGGMEVWQRGAGGAASFAVAASSTVYTVDRFYLATGANQASTVSQQAGLTTQSRWAARVQRNSGQTGTGVMRFAVPLDLDEILRMRGKIAVLSLWLRAGANWSPTSGTLSWALYVGTGAVGKRSGSAYTSETSPITGSVNLAQGGAAAQSVSISTAIPTGTTQAELQLFWTPTGTAGANDWLEVDDVQLEDAGAAATAAPTAFERVPFDVELLSCQRHYEKSYNYGTAPGSVTSVGAIAFIAYAAGNADWMDLRFKARKRVTPTVTLYSDATGASGNIRVVAVGDLAASAPNPGEHGAYVNAVTAAAANLHAHFVADAGI